MQRTNVVSLAVLLALLLVACGRDSSSGAATAASPDGAWVLDRLVTNGDTVPLPDIAIDFDVEGETFGGSAGCNSMGGRATFEGDGSLVIGEAFMTEMACMDTTLMDFEQWYMAALTGATGWAVEADRLTLQGPDTTLTYVVRTAPPDASLIGTVWTLDTFLDGEAAMNAAGMEQVTLTFDEGTIAAKGRCWTLTGPATIEPGGDGNARLDLDAADAVFTCDERAFLDEMVDRLNRVTEYAIAGPRLTLGTAGNPSLSLRG